jgi:hypothetical protein
MSSGDDDDSAPTPYDTGYFTDAAGLRAPSGLRTEEELAGIFRSLFRADLSGSARGAVLRSIAQADAAEREQALFALAEALKDDELIEWIEASEERRRLAEEIALAAAPPDPSVSHNWPVREHLQRFHDWNAFRYHVILVPGYTPIDAKTPAPGVHDVCRRRLEQALLDFRGRMAPFVLVSGGNVYPRGTPYYEAIEMKKALVAMGVSEDRIIVEARARHSTTNLRNAGRFMLDHGMRSAVITTTGGGVLGLDLFDQDFYFSNPTLSTFHRRCERELGYRVGALSGAGPNHTEFVPSPDVRRINYRDPLDP